MQEREQLTLGDRLVAHVPWLTLMILVTIESSLTGFGLPKLGLRIEDKIVHFLIFGILSWLLIRGFSMETIPWIRSGRFWLAIGLGLLFSFSDEWHQSMVQGRDASLGDLLADTLGILTFIYYFYFKQKKEKVMGALKDPPFSSG